MREVDVCVVGAGPHGLAVVTHVVAANPALRRRLAVVDPAGCWLARWRDQFARLEIDVLRSPIVHHPAVEPGALARFVADGGLPRSALPYDPPLTTTFDAFCDALVHRHGLGELPERGTVASIEPSGDGTTAEITTDRTSLRARHVVWTANTATPVIPSAFRSGSLAGRHAPLGGPVVHGGRVDLHTVGDLTGRNVLVVGGGLTAGHLVTAAQARGASVTLVTRRPIVERDFDVEPGWLGPRFLDGFGRLRRPEARLAAVRAARGGGSMPPWMRRRMSSAIEAGQLDHVVGEIDAVEHRATGICVEVAERSVHADVCWLATGTRPDARADAALQRLVGEAIDGVPIPARDLSVGGSNVFVTGRLAWIELGPAAGNLWGARVAARRITRAITGVDLDTDQVAAIEPPPLRAMRR